MKTFKTKQLIQLLILFCILATCFQCSQSRKQTEDHPLIGEDPISESPEECINLMRSAFRREVIIQWNKCQLDNQSKLERDELDHFLDSILKPIKTCVCDPELILYEIKEGINGEEAVAKTNAKLIPKGLGNAFFNFNLDRTVVNNFDKIPPPNLKEYDMPNEVLVAVIDGGINWELEPSIRDYLWHNPDSGLPHATPHGYNFVEDDRIEMKHHGLLVSRYITHNLNSDKLKLMDLRIINENGEGILFDALCAMQFAIDKNADIMNMSWGYYSQRFDQTFIKYIKKAKNENIILIASAGNDGLNTDYCHHYPSGFEDFLFNQFADNLISVAYLDDNEHKLSERSNYGFSTVALAAPGTFDYHEGSSYAAPHITRYASIIISNRPRLPYRRVIKIMEDHVNRNPELMVKTRGKILEGLDYNYVRTTADPYYSDSYFEFPDSP
jgi:hypothetical protein